MAYKSRSNKEIIEDVVSIEDLIPEEVPPNAIGFINKTIFDAKRRFMNTKEKIIIRAIWNGISAEDIRKLGHPYNLSPNNDTTRIIQILRSKHPDLTKENFKKTLKHYAESTEFAEYVDKTIDYKTRTKDNNNKNQTNPNDTFVETLDEIYGSELQNSSFAEDGIIPERVSYTIEVVSKMHAKNIFDSCRDKSLNQIHELLNFGESTLHLEASRLVWLELSRLFFVKFREDFKSSRQ
jgi:hypothetical protein